MKYEAVKVLNALGHSTRVEIFSLIKRNNNNLCYNDVALQLKLPFTTINFHIKKLKNAKLITEKKFEHKFLLSINEVTLKNTLNEFEAL